MKSTKTKILGLALLLGGLALISFGLSLLLRTPQYRATARIQVDQSDNAMCVISEASMRTGFDPYFIQTTFEVMQSEIVLSNVIATLELNVKWGKKQNHGTPLTLPQTMAVLKGNLLFAPVCNTRLVAITAGSNDPKEAADIANAIAESYRNYRIQTRRQLALTGLKTLEEDYQKRETELQRLQTNVAALRQANPAAPKNQAFADAEQKLEQFQDQQRLFRAKIDAFRTDIAIPKNSMVQIVDPAVPPKFPAVPNRLLGAILLVIGLISMLGGWLLVKPSHQE